MSVLSLRAIAAGAALSLAIATPAFAASAELSFTPNLAGPPWISVEFPVNPYIEGSQGAFCIVRVYHHGEAAFYPVSGTAEGLVNGERRSLMLDLAQTSLPGVYAVKYTPSNDGVWMLVLRIGKKGDEHGEAQALVTIREGKIASVSVPTRQDGRWTIPQPATDAQIDAMLRGGGSKTGM
jgi:hypothetical protein